MLRIHASNHDIKINYSYEASGLLSRVLARILPRALRTSYTPSSSDCGPFLDYETCFDACGERISGQILFLKLPENDWRAKGRTHDEIEIRQLGEFSRKIGRPPSFHGNREQAERIVQMIKNMLEIKEVKLNIMKIR